MNKRVALVTGGLGGLGSAISQSLSQAGHQVVATYFRGGDHSSARKWQEAQTKLGHHIEVIYADVRDYESCETMAGQVLERFGQVDILVNNAGITADKQLKKMPAQDWMDVINTNLNSVFNITKQFINSMINNQYGRIVNISSINGQKGQFGQTNYAAAKAGMHGFTKSLALEVAAKGITVNTISPGYLSTEMVTSVPENILNAIIDDIPMKRLGKTEEIARIVCFLCEEASGYITGANIPANGGHYLV